MEDYKNKYNEALERFRAFKEKYYTKDTSLGDAIYDKTGEMQKDFESIFPELRESEDERIRQALLTKFVGEKNQGAKYTIHGCSLDSIITYLEKQKDAFENGRQFGIMQEQARQELEWPNEKQKELEPDIELIQKTWYTEGYQDRKHNLEPMWIITTGEDGPKYELNPKYGKKLTEEQNLETFNEPYNPDEYEVVIEGNATSLKRKEQKPVDYDHEMWKNCEANFEGGKKEVIEHPEKYGLQKEQKPAWSEENEKIMDTIVSVLGQYIDYKAVSGTGSGYATPRYSKEIDWLKSLRPSWKPSDEQMEALEKAIVRSCSHQYGVPLSELYEQLKKL